MKHSLSILLATAALLPTFATAIISDQPNAENSQRALEAHVTRNMGAHSFPFWNNIGSIGRSTGVYLGGGYVLTAAHVGAGAFRMQDGSLYPVEPGSEQLFYNRDGSTADFCFFRVQFHASDSIAKLPMVPLATIAPELGTEVLLLGAGAGGSDSKNGGQFKWSDQHHLRWGVNQIEVIYNAPMPTYEYFSYGYATKFDQGGIECQAAPGDSGGACFRFNSQAKRWELAGIIVAVDSEFNKVEYGNQTYIADPALFRNELSVAYADARQSLVASR